MSEINVTLMHLYNIFTKHNLLMNRNNKYFTKPKLLIICSIHCITIFIYFTMRDAHTFTEFPVCGGGGGGGCNAQGLGVCDV